MMMQSGVADHAILICGSGVGMAIAANRASHIYAALCWSERAVIIAHEDDGVNVLVLAADLVSREDNVHIAKTMINAWIDCRFKGGRYQERLEMIDQ